MHNRRPLRLASTIGPVETGLLPALEGAFARQTAVPIEHEAQQLIGAFGRAEHGTSPYLRRDQIPITDG